MVAARVVFDKRDGQGPLEEGEQLGPSSLFQAFFTLLLDQLIHSCAILNQEEPYLQLCLQGSPSPKIRMNDNVVDFVGLAVQRLLFPILRVIFPKVHLDQKQNKFCKKINLRSHRDLAELGSVDAVGGGGDVPVVEENPPALVR